MRVRYLPRRVLQQVGIGSLQHARQTAVKTPSMLSQALAASAGFDADELHWLVLDELVEDANRNRAPADAGRYRGGLDAFGFEDLGARLAADDFVKIAHHSRIRMSAKHAAKKIMCEAHAGYSI